MARRILSVIAGIAVGVIIVMVGDAATHFLFPPPPDLNIENKEQMIVFVKSIPNSVFLIMFSFWILSSFTGGFVAGKINKAGWKRSSIVTGTILMAAAIINIVLLPHPVWMIIGVIILYIPAAWLGGKLAS